MNENLFNNLPTEIIIGILSTLPIPTIIMCKIVCKSWRDMVESIDFAKSHLSKSVPALVVSQDLPTHEHTHNVFQFVHEHLNSALQFSSKLNPCNRSFSFSFPHHVSIHSSVDGLLFMLRNQMPHICNPITREYIKLPLPRYCPSNSGIYGFGVSKISGQYKLVRISAAFSSPKCEVYTLGTRCWRIIAADTTLKYESGGTGVLLNGNLHWLAFDLNGSTLQISCFHLETELFSTFSVPSLPHGNGPNYQRLAALRDRLCLCDNLDDGGFVIWSMKAYGNEKSWTREFVFKENLFHINFVNIFKDGDMMIAKECSPQLVRFSTKTNTIRTIKLSGLCESASTSIAVYTPSFLSLIKTLVSENVRSF